MPFRTRDLLLHRVSFEEKLKVRQISRARINVPGYVLSGVLEVEGGIYWKVVEKTKYRYRGEDVYVGLRLVEYRSQDRNN